MSEAALALSIIVAVLLGVVVLIGAVVGMVLLLR